MLLKILIYFGKMERSKPPWGGPSLTPTQALYIGKKQNKMHLRFMSSDSADFSRKMIQVKGEMRKCCVNNLKIQKKYGTHKEKKYYFNSKFHSFFKNITQYLRIHVYMYH